ncbi:MAG: FAD-binding oxidoreductase [Candidatus Kapabacteria bacterium]|nr:FAD-binding oxidoreductase [Candidatus Kapabacteria bacterium]
MHVEPWGRTPIVEHADVKRPAWLRDCADVWGDDMTTLAIGNLRSYGDSCLNDNARIVDMTQCSRFIAFDKERGVIRCEAGVLLSDILNLIVPYNWFLPVTPGTKFVTVGGAVANDIHGKNHHCKGTFGCHVLRFELLRSDGSRTECSPGENAELFAATIGGLGLTGIVLWVEFSLTRIASPFITQTNIRFGNMDDYMLHSRTSDSKYDYVVSWIDCASSGASLGRGIFMGGNFADPLANTLPAVPAPRSIPFPIEAPSWMLNTLSIKAFNMLYYGKQTKPVSHHVVHYEPFFYPLDSILHWNKMYGKNGFFQYQFVVPFDDAASVLRDVLKRTARTGNASFLAVLKNFGAIQSPGMLSFPMEGVTLAMDFKNEGGKTLAFMTELDAIIRSAGGRLYPAKDARMTAEDFQRAYPNWSAFAAFIDPQCSSTFWRRVSRSAMA